MLCMGFKEEMFACLLQSHGETIKGNAVFCPCFSLILKTIQKIEHDLACMGYVKIFCNNISVLGI